MHDKEIVHRDIKAENVLIDDKDVSKLCDFNISCVMKRNQLEPASVFIGTKLYSPPELIVKAYSKEMYSPYEAVSVTSQLGHLVFGDDLPRNHHAQASVRE